MGSSGRMRTEAAQKAASVLIQMVLAARGRSATVVTPALLNAGTAGPAGESSRVGVGARFVDVQSPELLDTTFGF